MQAGALAEQRPLVAAVVVAQWAETKPSPQACGRMGASEERWGNKVFAASFGRVSGNALYLVP